MPPPRARDTGSPASLILMIRHARLGVAAADHNAHAYLILSDACKALWKTQEDHWSLGRGQGAPLRTSLRRIQTITALKTSLNLNPEDPRVHEVLGEMYVQLHFLDVALDHFSLALRCVDRVRPSAANRAARDNFNNYKKTLELKVRSLADAVKQRRADYDLRTAGLGPLEKFEWALRRPYRPLDAGNRGKIDMEGFGLAKKALTELQKAKVDTLGPAQKFQLANHQIDLLLTLGQIQEVGAALPDLQEVVGPYHAQYQLLWAAAVGNYAVADQSLEQQIKNLELAKHRPILLSSYLQILAPSNSYPGLFCRSLFFQNQSMANVLLQRSAELHLVRGLLALEKGDVNKAEGYFQKTLDLVGNTVYFPDRPIAQRYLELIRKQ